MRDKEAVGLPWVFEAGEVRVGGMTVVMARGELRKVRTLSACFVFLLYIFDPREFKRTFSNIYLRWMDSFIQ